VSVIRAMIHRSKTYRTCTSCHKVIKKGRRYLRAFGHAEESDPPFEIIEHPTCLNGMKADQKIRKALDDAKIEYEIDRHGHFMNIVDPELR